MTRIDMSLKHGILGWRNHWFSMVMKSWRLLQIYPVFYINPRAVWFSTRLWFIPSCGETSGCRGSPGPEIMDVMFEASPIKCLCGGLALSPVNRELGSFCRGAGPCCQEEAFTCFSFVFQIKPTPEGSKEYFEMVN